MAVPLESIDEQSCSTGSDLLCSLGLPASPKTFGLSPIGSFGVTWSLWRSAEKSGVVEARVTTDPIPIYLKSGIKAL